jgi:hypothetical protein
MGAMPTTEPPALSRPNPPPVTRASCPPRQTDHSTQPPHPRRRNRPPKVPPTIPNPAPRNAGILPASADGPFQPPPTSPAQKSPSKCAPQLPVSKNTPAIPFHAVASRRPFSIPLLPQPLHPSPPWVSSAYMDDSFTHDVFLSHSSLDKPLVRELAARLQSDGVKVWLDEREIHPGDNIPAKIEEGLEHSRILLFCMSKNAFAADWPFLESQIFRFRDPLNKSRRFIPLRLDDAEIKGSRTQSRNLSNGPAKTVNTTYPPPTLCPFRSKSSPPPRTHRVYSRQFAFDSEEYATLRQHCNHYSVRAV